MQILCQVKRKQRKRKDWASDKSKRRFVADYVVKQALAAWGDSSNDSNELEHPKDTSMMAMEEHDNIYSFIFSFYGKNQMMMKMKG